MSTDFIPQGIEPPSWVSGPPHFEDSKKEGIEGHTTTKSVRRLQDEIRDIIYRMGGDNVMFTPGTFPGPTPRYGYRLTCRINGVGARIDCAALPLRRESEQRKQQALQQALYFLRDRLSAEYRSLVFLPGSFPLVPYLLGAGGQTVTDALIEGGGLPQLAAGEVVVGEIVEDGDGE